VNDPAKTEDRLTRHECRADAACGRARVVNDPAKTEDRRPKVFELKTEN
jgi:hypothetical protein